VALWLKLPIEFQTDRLINPISPTKLGVKIEIPKGILGKAKKKAMETCGPEKVSIVLARILIGVRCPLVV
jgi:hypothetical protein